MNCSFATGDSPCGHVSEESLMPVDACTIDTTSHLSSLRISGKWGWRDETKLSEKELVLTRAGHFNLSEERTAAMVICPKHQQELTVD